MPDLIEHTTRLRVRYADTDKMGVVYYGKYFEYFEVARTEMLRSAGLPYAIIEAAGFGLPVSKASAEYYKGARYDDELVITVSMPDVVSPRLEISYRISIMGSEELIAIGATTLVFVDSATGKPSRPPKMYRDAIEAYKLRA